MIAKKFRFGKKKDFEKVFASKNKFYSNHFVLYYISNDKENNRFAITVSRKISNKAVDRNRIRRKIYEILRLNLDNIKISSDLVFMVKKSILNLNYQEIEKDLLDILKKAKLMI